MFNKVRYNISIYQSHLTYTDNRYIMYLLLYIITICMNIFQKVMFDIYIYKYVCECVSPLY